MSSFLFYRRLISISNHLHCPKLSSSSTSPASTLSSPPEPLLALLKSHNFSDSHISTLISKRPSILRSNATLNLAPKLSFLLSDAAAVPPYLLPDLITSNPSILSRSLDHHLKPVFHLLRSFIDSADELIIILRRQWYFLTCSLNRSVSPNIASLLSLGVPRDRIAKLITTNSRSLMLKPDLFRVNAAAVRRAGIEPDNPMFVYALRALNGMNKSTWDSRLKLFKEIGWSEELVYAAFRRAPLFLLVSDEKIRKSTEFFMKEVGFGPEVLSVQPKLLMYAFEKRVIPRFKVFQVLKEKGLVKKGGKKGKKVVVDFFTCSDKVFLARYVARHCERAPELMDVWWLPKVGIDGQGTSNC